MTLRKSFSTVTRRMVIAPSSYEEIFEAAVRKSQKIAATSLYRNLGYHKKVEIRRIESANRYVVKRLKDIALTTPFLKELHPFYKELLSVLIDIDSLKKSVSRIYRASSIVNKISRECIRKVRQSKDHNSIIKHRRSYFGRLKSILKKLDKDFKVVRKAQLDMLKLPDVRPEIFTVVVAGPPNVGKSSLIRAITKAKPEVREYPFTTKSLTVGHIKVNSTIVQVLDTPGLLDRPLSERNKIELQAILALKHLADLIIFMFDPTETCGFPLSYQKNVLSEVLNSFRNVPFIYVANKVDVASKNHIQRIQEIISRDFSSNIVLISAKERINLEEVLKLIEKHVKEKEQHQSS